MVIGEPAEGGMHAAYWSTESLRRRQHQILAFRYRHCDVIWKRQKMAMLLKSFLEDPCRILARADEDELVSVIINMEKRLFGLTREFLPSSTSWSTGHRG